MMLLFWIFFGFLCVFAIITQINYYNRPLWQVIREERLRVEAEERRKPKRRLKP